MKDLKKMAKRIKELDTEYEKTGKIELEEEMAKIMNNLSFKELLEIEKFLTK